jgi:hypothetical protein
MSILVGILLYMLIVAFFCGLTGLNRLDGPEVRARRTREQEESEPQLSATPVPAPEANG